MKPEQRDLRGRKLSEPSPKAHPWIHVVYHEMVAKNLCMANVAKTAGLSPSTIWRMWKGKHITSIESMEALLNAVGRSLMPSHQLMTAITKLDKVVPKINFKDREDDDLNAMDGSLMR